MFLWKIILRSIIAIGMILFIFVEPVAGVMRNTKQYLILFKGLLVQILVILCVWDVYLSHPCLEKGVELRVVALNHWTWYLSHICVREVGLVTFMFVVLVVIHTIIIVWGLLKMLRFIILILILNIFFLRDTVVRCILRDKPVRWGDTRIRDVSFPNINCWVVFVWKIIEEVVWI